MAANLKTGFRERQCKRLFESIVIATLPIKKPYPKTPLETPIPDIPSISRPSTDVVGANNVPSTKSPTRMNTSPTQNGISSDIAPPVEDLDKKKATAPLCAPNWEEMVEMLK